MKRLLETTAVAVLVLTFLLAGPAVVKAATDGDVDLYQMIADLLTRVDEQEEEIGQMQAKIVELEGQLEEQAVPAESEPEPAPAPEPDPEPEPAPAPDPEPNPYAHLSLDGIKVITIDYRAAFSRWSIEFDEENRAKAEQARYKLTDDGKLFVCTNREVETLHLDSITADLDEKGVAYTVKDVSIDPLFWDMTRDVRLPTIEEALDYIESKITGE